MSKKKKIGLVSLCIIAVLIMVISVSYAYFTSVISGTANPNVITSGTMRLEFTDGPAISLQGALPGDSVTKTFNVRNTGTLTTTYDVYFSEICNMFVDKTDLVYTIRHTSANGYELLTETEVPSTSSKIIDSQSIAPNETQTYEITIKFLNKDENQDDNQGAHFSSKLNINNSKEPISCPIKIGSTLCSFNCDTDSNGTVDTNIDNNNDGICDLNCDRNNDNTCDINCDDDNDGVADSYIDDNGDGRCDRNCMVACTNKVLKDRILCEEGGAAAIEAKPAFAFTTTEPASVYTDGGISEEIKTATPESGNYNYYMYSDSYTFDGEKKQSYFLDDPQIGQYSEIYNNLVDKYILFTVGMNQNTAQFRLNDHNFSVEKLYYVINATENEITYKEVINNVLTEKHTEGMYATQDDLGTSYYYRGEIEDNYVSFGGFCWRVVRINGDGSIRLIYQGTTCDAAGNNTIIGISSFSKDGLYNDNAYVGYMYGTAGSSTYAATHANINSSNAKTQLESWYATNLSTYDSLIADQIFCNDRSVSTEWGTGLGYGGTPYNDTGYGAMERAMTSNELDWDTTQYPTLMCAQKNDRFTKNDTVNGNGALSQKVGMLTYDEAVMAGGFGGMYNTSYYLYTGANWWLGSPLEHSMYDGGFMFVVYKDCIDYDILADYSTHNVYGLRPVISLNNNVEVSSGDGTQSNPWVIKTN